MHFLLAQYSLQVWLLRISHFSLNWLIRQARFLKNHSRRRYLLSHCLIPGTTNGYLSFMLGLVSGASLSSNLILHASDLGIKPGLGGSSGSFGLGTSLYGLSSNSLGFLLGSKSISLTFKSHLMPQLEFSISILEFLVIILGLLCRLLHNLFISSLLSWFHRYRCSISLLLHLDLRVFHPSLQAKLFRIILGAFHLRGKHTETTLLWGQRVQCVVTVLEGL